MLNVLRRHTRMYQAARAVRMGLGRIAPPRRYDGIPGRVHYNDFMLSDTSPEGIEQYRAGALDVIGSIESTLSRAGRGFDDVDSWLDFGCGYGRVVRFLVEKTPADRVWASDVIEEAVDFCAAEFGVHPAPSRGALVDVDLPRPFDFLYAISVITHLDEENSTAFLRRLGEWLAPDGLVLFTIHGRWSLEHLEYYGDAYVARRAEIEREVRGKGFAFVPYHHYSGDDYGMTWHSAEYVKERIEEIHGGALELVSFESQGLDGRQDAFAYRRVS
jgi:SAM-dependent methyltransferase